MLVIRCDKGDHVFDLFSGPFRLLEGVRERESDVLGEMVTLVNERVKENTRRLMRLRLGARRPSACQLDRRA